MKPQPGDVIVFLVKNKTNSIVSKIIAFLTRYTVGNWVRSSDPSSSHVSIVSEKEGWHYESTIPKSIHCEFKKEWFEKYDIVYLSYNGITEEQRNMIIDWCKKNTNKWYDLVSLLTLGLINPKGIQVCSEFVGEAYKSAGIVIFKEGEKILSPNEIYYNKNFKK